ERDVRRCDGAHQGQRTGHEREFGRSDPRRLTSVHAAFRHAGGLSPLLSRNTSPANAARNAAAAQIAGQSRTTTAIFTASGSWRKSVALIFDHRSSSGFSSREETSRVLYQRMNTSPAFFGTTKGLALFVSDENDPKTEGVS